MSEKLRNSKESIKRTTDRPPDAVGWPQLRHAFPGVQVTVLGAQESDIELFTARAPQEYPRPWLQSETFCSVAPSRLFYFELKKPQVRQPFNRFTLAQ